MSGFRDIYAPSGFKGYPTTGSAIWSTTIQIASSGTENRNANRAHPLFRYTLPEAVRDHATFAAARNHFMAMRGPLYSFPMRDPLDFASRELEAADLVPPVGSGDVVIGIGDGVTKTFQLKKPYRVAYGAEVEVYEREIHLPIVDTVVIAINGLPPETAAGFLPNRLPGGPYSWTVERRGGLVTLDKPLAPDLVLTAGFLFDVPVRFETDDALQTVTSNYRVSGFSDIVLVETPLC